MLSIKTDDMDFNFLTIKSGLMSMCVFNFDFSTPANFLRFSRFLLTFVAVI